MQLPRFPLCASNTPGQRQVCWASQRSVFQLPRALSCCESGFCAALICFCAAEDALNIPIPGRCCALTGRGGRFKVLRFCSLLSQEDLVALVLLPKARSCPQPTRPCGQTASAPSPQQDKTGRKVVPCQRLGRHVAFCWGGTCSFSSPAPPCHDYQCCVLFSPLLFPAFLLDQIHSTSICVFSPVCRLGLLLLQDHKDLLQLLQVLRDPRFKQVLKLFPWSISLCFSSGLSGKLFCLPTRESSKQNILRT